MRCECGRLRQVKVYPLRCSCGRVWTGPDTFILARRAALTSAPRSAGPSEAGRPHRGPGAHLAELIRQVAGPISWAGCGCASYAAQMDRWGVEGCRQRREEIVAHLRQQLRHLDGAKLARAAWGIVGQGWAWPSPEQLLEALGDPVGYILGSMLDEAFRRAAADRR